MYRDSENTLKLKVVNIGPDHWHFPNYVSKHAKDFICNLCRISTTERFDVKKALQHPWITRDFAPERPIRSMFVNYSKHNEMQNLFLKMKPKAFKKT